MGGKIEAPTIEGNDMTAIHAPHPVTCTECGFSSSDLNLVAHHSCDIQEQGGQCEDFPACGHERGDCNGLLYGSDEAIKAQVETDWRTGHGYCDHAEGLWNCEFDD
jgi:hypothetical protein